MNSQCFFIGTTLADNPTPQQFVGLADELVRRGHRAVIFAPHRRIDLESCKTNPAIYTWPSERPTKWRDARFLRSQIRQWRPSCLIANFAAVNVMMLQGWLSTVPMRVSWYHTISSQLDLDNPQPAWKSALFRWRKRFVYAAATHVAANSDASARDVQLVFGVRESKCRVFHNSLADPAGRLLLPAEPPIPGRLVCVGRFNRSKGQDVLIRALAIVKRKVPSAHVEFIGEGPSQSACEALASKLGVRDKCLFSGRVAHGDVLQKMRTAAATVVPSRNEAFGLVNIESMAVGTPVIASNIGGIPEIIRNGVDGVLAPPNCAESLARALQLLLSDSNLRREMSGNARERFVAKFELSRAVREQAGWLEETLLGLR